MKRAIIFLYGNKPSTALIKKYIKKSDFIIAADGGAGYILEAGLLPHIAIGDFDSLAKKYQIHLEKKNIETIPYPVEKDETDSELAIKYAVKNGYKNLILFGVYGDRIDHVLANLMHIAALQDDVATFKIIEGKQEIYIVKRKVSLRGKKSELVSLIPLQQDVKGIYTKGLKWKLYNDTLKFGEPRGMSNELTTTKAEIEINSGTLLVVHTNLA